MIHVYFKKLLLILALFMISGMYPVICQAAGKQKSDWLVYIYLVGSDLESDGGAASGDLNEIIEAKPGKNVRVLVETGGARKWHGKISSSELGRYTVENGKLVKLDAVKNRPMGDAETLTDFIKWGDSRYDAEHRMLILWNHGGGPAGGVGYDELYQNSFLKMDEVHVAMSNAFGDRAFKYFDIIGFDACLMANFNVASLLSPFADYMIASEELEPGAGWSYDVWLAELVKKPKMTPLEVSKAVVDSYADFMSSQDIETTTLSVIDLNRFPKLAVSVMDFSEAVGSKVLSNRQQLNYVERMAQRDVQFYGFTKKAPNCPESLDMGQFVQGLSRYDSKKADEVLRNLDSTVVYKRNGRYRKGSGLAMYYPVSKDVDKYAFFLEHNVNTGFAKIFGDILNVLDDDVVSYLDAYQQNGKEYFSMLAGLEQSSAGAGAGTVASSEDDEEESDDEDDENYGEDDEDEADDADDEDEADADENVGTGGGILGGLLNVVNVTGGSSSATSDAASAVATGLTGGFSNALELSAGNRKLTPEFRSIENIMPKFNSKGHSYVQLTTEQLAEVSRVDIAHMMIILPSDDNPDGAVVVLGFDETLEADWKKGIFTDNVDNTWICLDGNPLSVNVVNSTDDYIFYESPIKLNGTEYMMEIIYDRKDKEYRIIGMQTYNDEGLPVRSNVRLTPGDRIIPLFSVSPLQGEADDDNMIEMDEIVYKKDSKVIRESMGENSVAFSYTFYNASGDDVSSDMVHMESDDEDNIRLKLFDTFLEENAETIMKYIKD